MKDKLSLSKKELNYKSILDLVLSKTITAKKAADRLGISYRHIKRLIIRYKECGSEGLIHKSRGKVSPRKTDQATVEQIIKFRKEKYEGYGPTLMAEKLAELEGIQIHKETLRLLLKANGLWGCKRTRKKHRTRRDRRLRFGELLQLDGSIHNWLPGKDTKKCLVNLVDDATGKTLSILAHGETIEAIYRLLKWWVELHGVPEAIYVDLKSVYISPKALKEDEEVVEKEWLTHFTALCKRLNIRVIKAYSPQAKGRVERSHAVYQDRFVKELKLLNVNTIEEANKVLKEGFIDNLNSKFMKEPTSTEDAHIMLSEDQDLNNIFSWQYERIVSNDMVVRFENKYLQIENAKEVRLAPKQKIEVKKHLDSGITLWKGDLQLKFNEVETITKAKTVSIPLSAKQRSEISRANKHKSPWSRYNPNWLKKTSSGLHASN